MPRIVFITVQLALVAGIALMGFAMIEARKPDERADRSIPPAATGPKTAPESNSQAKPFSQYQIIARRDLFRTPKDEKPAQAAIDVEALKPTDLKLKLWGTITGQDGMTRAVIEDQSKKRQALYRTGDEVSGAKVKMILREKVILAVKGEDQVLEIEKPSKTVRGPASAPRAPRAGVARGAVAPQKPRSPARRRTIRLKLSRLGEISDDPGDWGNYATAAPYTSEDGSNGVMLNRITPSSPLRRIGIRNGDVILTVNEQPVGELATLLQALAEVSAGEALSLKIKRRGKERRLDFKFE